MREGIIVKAPRGSEPEAIRNQWLMLRFIFEECREDDGPCVDTITGAAIPFAPYSVDCSEAYRIMDAQRPGMSAWYKKNSHRDLVDCNFVFYEDEIHFLEGTEQAWG